MKNTILAATVLFAVSLSPALSAGKTKSAPTMPMKRLTPSQREEMATLHEKMAACLRSDKPVEDCRKEMMKSCKMDKDSCPMMGKMQSMMHGEEETK